AGGPARRMRRDRRRSRPGPQGTTSPRNRRPRLRPARPRRPAGYRGCRTRWRLASVATVSRVRHLPGVRALGPVLLVVITAEGGARLLAPRESAIEPADVDPGAYFSRQEIERGARFARPQARLALARAMLELVVLAALARRGGPKPRTGLARVAAAGRRLATPRRQSRRRELAGGAIAGASLAAQTTVAGLPLSVLARRRAIAVGLITQSWRGWALDLLKATAIESALAGSAGAAVIAIMRRYPRGWWLPAGAGSAVAGGL